MADFRYSCIRTPPTQRRARERQRRQGPRARSKQRSCRRPSSPRRSRGDRGTAARRACRRRCSPPRAPRRSSSRTQPGRCTRHRDPQSRCRRLRTSQTSTEREPTEISQTCAVHEQKHDGERKLTFPVLFTLCVTLSSWSDSLGSRPWICPPVACQLHSALAM